LGSEQDGGFALGTRKFLSGFGKEVAGVLESLIGRGRSIGRAVLRRVLT